MQAPLGTFERCCPNILSCIVCQDSSNLFGIIPLGRSVFALATNGRLMMCGGLFDTATGGTDVGLLCHVYCLASPM